MCFLSQNGRICTTMFTGIIKEIGKISAISHQKGGKLIRISAKTSLKKRKIGNSIAVDGACLTITKLGKNYFEADITPETLRKTRLALIKKGETVNLETPLKVGDTIDGHFTLGHIDATGIVKKIKEEGNSRKIIIEFPEHIAKYLACKGSITVNGVSLTISDLRTKTFEVALIPETLKRTNLGNLKVGTVVNIEVDLIARYINGSL